MVTDGLLSGVEIKPGTPLDRLVAMFVLDRQYAHIFATLMNSHHCSKEKYNYFRIKFIEASGPFEKTKSPNERSLSILRKLQRKLNK